MGVEGFYSCKLGHVIFLIIVIMRRARVEYFAESEMKAEDGKQEW